MTTTSGPAPATWKGESARLASWWPFLALVLAALVVRAPFYGNPDVYLDEQYYLLVGDRMWHGALPYVDLWDRKPIGLFLIYAAIRLLGGDGVIQYQIVASLCAGGTAGLIWLMSRRITGNFAATFAGLIYIFWLTIFSGGAGQSPVLYNLITAITALLAFQANDSDDAGAIMRRGRVAMLLWGCILQIKYTAAPEGMFFGLWFLWSLWRRGCGITGLLAAGAQFALLGLAPTLAVAAFYAAIGQFDAFFYANFLSIFTRGELGAEMNARVVTFFSYATPPFVLVVLFGFIRRAQADLRFARTDTIMLAGWSAAALLGFAMVGNFYDHYFIPCLLPGFLVAAPLFQRTLVGTGIGLFLIFESVLASHFPDIALHRRKRIAIERLTEAIRPYVAGGRCLYIYDGPSILYHLTGACIPTRYAYPDHLSNRVERHSVGVDTQAEVRRVLATRPGAIVTADLGVLPGMDPLTAHPVSQVLDRDYVCVAAVPTVGRTFQVHALRALVKPGTRTIACPSTYLK
ncbi:MAG: hypothetical protein QHC40_06490 [Sphingobium sp.]|nr:hypothetical protein [Sphingobium sp.]